MTRPSPDPSISNGSGRTASAAQLVSLSVGKMANLRLAGEREGGSSLDFIRDETGLVWILANGGAGAGAEVCTWTLLTRQTELSVRVVLAGGESNIWCEFCRQGQTAGKKYQLMQEQQSPDSLPTSLIPSNKTEVPASESVFPSCTPPPHIDIWLFPFFPSRVAPT